MLRLIALLLAAPPAFADVTVTISSCSVNDECDLAIEGDGQVTLELAEGRFDWARVNGFVLETDPPVGGNADGAESPVITVTAPLVARFDVDPTVFNGGTVTVDGVSAQLVESAGTWTATVPVQPGEPTIPTRRYEFRVEYPTAWEDGEPMSALDIAWAKVYCDGPTSLEFTVGPLSIQEIPYGSWTCSATVVSVQEIEGETVEVESSRGYLPSVLEVGPAVEPRVPGAPGFSVEALE